MVPVKVNVGAVALISVEPVRSISGRVTAAASGVSATLLASELIVAARLPVSRIVLALTMKLSAVTVTVVGVCSMVLVPSGPATVIVSFSEPHLLAS